MGTVVGAIIFCFLCLQRPETQPLLFGIFGVTPPRVCNAVSVCAAACAEAAAAVQSHSISLDASRLTLLAVYGLVYCYVASAPILVFHAGRFLIDPETTWKSILKGSGICAVFLLVGTFSGRFVAEGEWFAFTASCLILLLALEAAAVFFSVKRSEKLFEFYSKLAERRSEPKGEIVDSYRHLREHGNSFFIVFLELGLGVVLFEASKLGPQDSCRPGPVLGIVKIYLSVLVLWIFPAVCVWLISTLFERRFSEAQVPPELPPLPKAQ
jgi:hypothetical protein